MRPVCLTLVILCGSASQPTSASAADREPLQQAVVVLLETGLQRELLPLARLQAEYQQALTTAGGPHPALEYAYSIALRKHAQAQLGQEMLERAAASTAPLVLPAREELLRQQVARGQYVVALQQLIDLADVVGQIPPQGADALEARRCAEWIGLMFGYLTGPAENAQARQVAQARETELLDRLGPHYLPEFRWGVGQVELMRRRLLEEVEQKEQVVQQTQQQVAEVVQQNVQAVEEQKDQLRQQAGEYVTVAIDELRDLDTKIGIVAKQLEVNLHAEQTLMQTLISNRLEIERVERDIDLAKQQIPGRRITAQHLQQLFAHLDYLQKEQVVGGRDHAYLIESRVQLMARGRELVAQRNALAAKHSLTAQAASTQIQQLSHLQQRIKQEEIKAGQDPAVVPLIQTQRKQLRALSSYVPGGFEDERERLLTSLGVE